MREEILRRIVRESGVPDLVEVLASRLPGSDLQSLLLEVFQRRSAELEPAALLKRYASDDYSRPAALPAERLNAFDRLAFSLVPEGCEVLELSPVAPLGSCSAVATVAQDKVVSATRQLEVMADSTNALALECALRRRERLARGERHGPVCLAASQRLVRAQSFGPGYFRHFRVWALCTADRDAGGFRFEAGALHAQLDHHLRLLGAAHELGLQLGPREIDVSDFSGGRLAPILRERVCEPLARDHPDARITLSDTRESGRGYYLGACFKLYARTAAGERLELGDGGDVPWTAKLLGNGKERLVISGLGIERLLAAFA